MNTDGIQQLDEILYCCPVCETVRFDSEKEQPHGDNRIRRTCVNGHVWDEPHFKEPEFIHAHTVNNAADEFIAAVEHALEFADSHVVAEKTRAAKRRYDEIVAASRKKNFPEST